MTRFLRNPAVTTGEMVETAAAGVAARCAGRRVLAIQDTTVTRSEGGGGEYLHAVVVVDADDKALLGLAHACALERSSGRRAGRRERPVAEKESRRWLDGAQRAGAVCAAARQVIVVADRESDIWEAFARRPSGTELLVRAAHDRSLADGGRLFAVVDARPELGRASLDLPARGGRPARTAVLSVRVARVDLARPRGRPSSEGDQVGAVPVTLVDLREVGGGGLHWRLLTTLPAIDLTQALEMAELYRCRWMIEQVFRTLKTAGFDIENLRIADPAARARLVMAALVAAVIVQQLVHAREGGPSPLRPLTDAVDPDDQPLLQALCRSLEGKTARQKNPHPPSSLAYAAWVCARLGGWTGYYGKPGPVVMLNGWLEFQAAKRAAILLANQNV